MTLMKKRIKKTFIKRKGEQDNKVCSQQKWSDLPHDILLLISTKLHSSSDLLSLKGVCTSWTLAMMNRTRIAYPMLVLFRESVEKISNGNKVINNEFFLFSMNDDVTKYKFKKMLSLGDQHCRIRIIGSHPDGWVILEEKMESYHLLHLFLGIRIQLPNMASNGRRLVDLTKQIIRIAILSANDQHCREDFIVVISLASIKKLAIWRYGDCRWNFFGGTLLVIDVAFCKNTIYAIRRTLLHGHTYIESWDLKNKKYLPEKKLCIKFFDDYWFAKHLVVSSADEIFVWNFSIWHSEIKRCIYKLDSSKKQCILVNSLDGRTLFRGFGVSVILSANEVESLGFKTNSIYLAEKEEDCIKLTTYSFDNIDCNQPEFQQWQMQNKMMKPLGLFLLST